MWRWFQTGSPWIWLTASAVSLSLIAVLGLFLLISWRGLTYFWPHPVYEWQIKDHNEDIYTLIGELKKEQFVSSTYLREAGLTLPPQTPDIVERFLVKTGNREFVSLDFRWILAQEITKTQKPDTLIHIERRSNGDFFGYPVRLVENGNIVLNNDLESALLERIQRINRLHKQEMKLQKTSIGRVNYQLDKLRLKERKAKLENRWHSQLAKNIQDKRNELISKYQSYAQELEALRTQAKRDTLIVKDMRGLEVSLPLANIIEVIWPNRMTIAEKIVYWCKQILRFVTDEPREANTEGGVFPAIFGTVLMVLIMSVLVTPLGVITAIYLHEYAGNNTLTRLTRIAVINLAGVPSIVYGVFGLGFFVYFMGGSIDHLFYPESLPSPTFGTPGILWSALTLAILTLPVVIVSTEEGLARIPNSLREGSLALGATKAETLFRIVVPMASPAIMTGLILAVARAAGEVAPLMLVGVVKFAPNLPLDGNFPYIHLERKFMHLGFQIYDVGFQSPNVEASQPLVYATSLLLVLVIIILNLTAISIRNRLREKYRTLDH